METSELMVTASRLRVEGYLDSEEIIEEYIEAAIDEGDQFAFVDMNEGL